MKGLLWFIVQHIRSQKQRMPSRPVQFDAQLQRMTTAVLRLPSSFIWLSNYPLCATRVFHSPQWHCDMCLPIMWLVKQRKSLPSLQGFTKWCCNPTSKIRNQKLTDLDTMKLNFLRDLPFGGNRQKNFGKLKKNKKIKIILHFVAMEGNEMILEI